MQAIYKLPLVFTPQSEGGFTVTCPLVPELITEGDSVTEAFSNASDALAAVIETYQDLGKPLPSALRPVSDDSPIWAETLVPVGA